MWGHTSLEISYAGLWILYRTRNQGPHIYDKSAKGNSVSAQKLLPGSDVLHKSYVAKGKCSLLEQGMPLVGSSREGYTCPPHESPFKLPSVVRRGISNEWLHNVKL